MTDSRSGLCLENLTVAYGANRVVSDVNACVRHGELVAVVGPNGAGKSTLFKALVGLAPISAGRVQLDGGPLCDRTDCVAYVAQREEVDWHFPVTVLDVVLMGRYRQLGWIRRPGRSDREIARRCLDQLGVADLAERPIGELSGGQQQRVFLARALAQEPTMLILDEPFSGVDSPTQEVALGVLRDLAARGIVALVSTHDISLAATRFDKVMLLNRRLVAFGAPSEALSSESLTATFGAQVLVYPADGGIIAVADSCCPGDHELVMPVGSSR